MSEISPDEKFEKNVLQDFWFGKVTFVSLTKFLEKYETSKQQLEGVKNDK